MEFVMHPIGLIHTPFRERTGMPIQSARSDTQGTVEIYPQFLEGLDGIEDFSRVYFIYAFHLSEPLKSLKVRPFLDDHFYGVFSTRYPSRPNPIGLSIVQLTGREGSLLTFSGADMLDETPLLDLKPYIPEFDIFPVEKKGWYQNRKYQ
jgi:tRNA (adenine37-N6)-methyltransferase